jgi:hypothetical protein
MFQIILISFLFWRGEIGFLKGKLPDIVAKKMHICVHAYFLKEKVFQRRHGCQRVKNL